MRGSGEQPEVLGFAIPLILAAALLAGLDPDPRVLDPLTLMLAVGAALANLTAVQYGTTLWVSAAFTCSMLAVAILGPAATLVVLLLAELGTWAVDRIRLRALAINAAGSTLPSVCAALVLAPIAAGRETGPAFIAALAACATATLIANFVIVTSLTALESGAPILPRLRPPAELLVPLLWSVALTAATVEVYQAIPPLGGAVLVLLLIGFTVMARLIATARSRSTQYTELAVGAAAALLRALETRDPRAARHAAAVGAFARDIVHEAGMSPRECELAHAAGLLHDIGRTAIADRSMGGDGDLSRQDWMAIARHPQLGADIVRDVNMPSLVANAVAAHHERVDGFGYPDGLEGEAIPALARAVAVAEVYDTLTAGDTYRPRMSSFQAMVELRRVAGSQVDERFVEALATVLAGRELEYRHASAAHLDGDIRLKRRLADALNT
jgi:putative nucleotidyltransferase with HDIG domain